MSIVCSSLSCGRHICLRCASVFKVYNIDTTLVFFYAVAASR